MIFSRKHQHRWEIVGASFQPRPDELRSAQGMQAEMVIEVLYGFTLLTQQCTECGWVATSRTGGKPDLSKLGVEMVEGRAVGKDSRAVLHTGQRMEG